MLWIWLITVQEWLGGDTTQVESNYFGKGNTTSYDRAIYHTVSTPQTTFHTYTIDWTKQYVKWSIDGTLVRTLNYADALSGKNFPQTPMRVKLGNWVGGSATGDEGTVQWAGGLSDFSSSASLPYQMFVKSITIEDGTTSGSKYTYSDTTGDYSSITVAGTAGGSGATNATAESSSSGSSSGSASKVSSSSTAVVDHLGEEQTGSVSSSSKINAIKATGAVNSTTLSTGTGVASQTGTASSGFTQSSSTATSAASIAISTGGVGGKYGRIDVVVGILGLGLGYLVM